ncbi:DUF4232 domain-containing protein [Pseudofrankia saprophytica]|uniref:DUF4232 domain-containing protein n=1 Tax=Pseudofrankia saprophytica TaxID=298655 RepID=UPI000234BC43|nr:DUF4232 domain-containing protein [Pseudofrankia saprophytica]
MRQVPFVPRHRWVAGLALATVAGLSACDSPASSAGGNTGGNAPPAGGQTGTAAASTAPSPSPTSAVGRCGTADLAAALSAPPPAGTSQSTVHVTFRNRSSARCSLYGYPGVELREAGGDVWDLVRSPLVARTLIVLAPGDRAHATLTYLPTSPSDGTGNPAFTPATVALTPPDERTQLVVPWKGGPLVRQDGATHPGTYVSALEPGA